MADNVIDELSIEIEANATQSVDGVKRLSRALTSLATSITKVNGAGINNVSAQLKVMTTATGQAGESADKSSKGTSNYSSSLNSLVHSTNRASNSTKSLAYYFGKMYANCFLLIRGIKAIGKATESAMDYIEAFNFYDVAINSATAKTNEWQNLGYDSAESYAMGFKQGLGNLNEKMTGFSTNTKTGNVTPSSNPNLGINLTDLTTYQAEIVSITSSLGLMTKTSYDTANGLSMLAADMSSLHNIDLKTVMTNFQSGLIGQSRALYKYGIDITNATLQQYALANGVSKAVNQMSQSEKMQLRLLAILDQSKVAWGDLANTINQPANQMRVFTNGVKNLAITIGKLLLPVVSSVLPYLNAMVKALQTFFTWLANVAGIELDAGNAGSATSDVFDNIEDSADDASDAVNKLGKTLNKQLAGFDELNNMTSASGSSSSGSGGGAGIDLSDAISSAMENYEKAWEEAYANMTDKSTAMADTIVDAFRKKDYKGIGTYISTGITNALNSINWNKVYSVAEQFGSGFAEFLNGLITPDLFGAVGKTIASALNTAVYNSLAFSSTLDWANIGDSIASGINNFFETFDFKAFAKSLNSWVDGIKKAIIETIRKVSWKDVLGGLGDFLGELDFDTVTIIVGSFIWKHGMQQLTMDVLSSSLTSYLGLNNKANTLKVAATVTVGIGAISWILDGGLENASKDFAHWFNKQFRGKDFSDEDYDALIEGTAFEIDPEQLFNKLMTGDFTAEENLAKKMLDSYGFGDLGDYFSNINDGFAQWVEDRKKGLDDIGSSFVSFKDNVSGAFKNIGDFFSKFTSSASDNIGSFTDSVEEFKNGFISRFDALRGGVSDAWDKVTSFWNGKTKLSDVQAGIENFKENVREKWNNVVSFWNNKPVLKQITTTVSDFVSSIRDKWSKVTSFWSGKPALKQITATVSDFVSSIRDKWYNLRNWWSNLTLPSIWANIKLPHISVDWRDYGMFSIPHLSVKYYAKGGFPGMGELFVANENGPEMVGKMGNRSAVANTQQIVTGISEGVADANQETNALLRQQNELLMALLQKDTGISTRDIFNAVRSEDTGYKKSNGHSAFVY